MNSAKRVAKRATACKLNLTLGIWEFLCAFFYIDHSTDNFFSFISFVHKLFDFIFFSVSFILSLFLKFKCTWVSGIWLWCVRVHDHVTHSFYMIIVVVRRLLSKLCLDVSFVVFFGHRQFFLFVLLLSLVCFSFFAILLIDRSSHKPNQTDVNSINLDIHIYGLVLLVFVQRLKRKYWKVYKTIKKIITIWLDINIRLKIVSVSVCFFLFLF